MIRRRDPTIAAGFRIPCPEPGFLKPVVCTAYLIFALIISFSSARAQNLVPQVNQQSVSPSAQQQRLVTNYGKLPLSFEANQGQTNPNVKFLSRGHGYSLYLTGDEAVLALRGCQPSVVGGQLQKTKTTDQGPRTTDRIQLKLLGANAKAPLTGLDELPGKSNYFIGSDPKKWRTNVANYAKVKYENVYPGVDLVYHGNQRQLEYDFVVAPGADPKQIAMGIEAGNAKMEIGKWKLENRQSKIIVAADGDLVVRTGDGEVRFQKPVVYQYVRAGLVPALGARLTVPPGHPQEAPLQAARIPIDGRYVLRAHHQIGFEVASYDHAKPLIIDPVLSYSTYLGGSDIDMGFGIAVDTQGNAYVTGFTRSTNFPTVNPIKATLSRAIQNNSPVTNIVQIIPPEDVFITKINAAGTAFVYSTYLGGRTGQDEGRAIAVDTSGNAYVTGLTQSSDFPTVNPIQASCADCTSTPSNSEAFVAKLNPGGNALVYSTYLGGHGVHDRGLGIAVDPAGNAYVTGLTGSPDFPLANPLQATFGGGTEGDAFVTKINPAGTGFVYSTYLGGAGDDYGNGIATDSAGNAYVTGLAGPNFPTLNPLEPYKGVQTAFVSKISPDGRAFIYSTYLGGSGAGSGDGVAADSAGNAYVAGTTTSTDFPTVNAIQGTFGSGIEHAFVSKISPTGSALVYSTYLGGSDQDWALGIAIDSSDNAYVTGLTYSTDFPTTNAFAPIFFGPNSIEAYITEINAAGNAFVYSTYLGGSSEIAWAIAVDSAGNAYIAGQTSANGFPSAENFPTVMPTQPSYGGAQADAFVAKISPDSVPGVSFNPAVLTFAGQPAGTISAPQSGLLRNVGSVPLDITDIQITGTNASDFTQTNTCGAGVAVGDNCTINVTFAPAAGGDKTAALTITDNAPTSPQSMTVMGTGTPASAAVGLSPTVLTFNNQFVGTTSAAQAVTLTNTGNATLTISALGVSGDFAQTNNCGSSVAGGASCTISVTFTPTVPNTLSGTLTITDNASPTTQSVALTGTGTTSTATPSVTALTFHDQILGTTSTAQSVTLTNNGNLTLNVSNIAVSGDFARTSSCGTPVPAGSVCTINVTFTPTAPGTRTGTMTITDDAAGNPQTVALFGIGILGPQVTLNPTSLSFPAQFVGTSSLPQNIALTNTGDQTLTISNVQASSGYAQTSGCTTSLAPGVGCTIGVFFGPSPSTSGTITGTLTITDNAPDSPQTVSLSGTGQDFNLAPASGSSTTASVPAGSTAIFNLSLAPAGGFNQTISLTCAGAPQLSTCTVSPGVVTLSPTAPTPVVVTVTTTAHSLTPPRFGIPPMSLPPVLVWWLAFTFAALLVIGTVGARHGVPLPRVGFAATVLFAVMLAAISLLSCGGGSSTPPPPSGGTPSGTYHLSVTGTFASGTTTLSHSVPLTLTVN